MRGIITADLHLKRNRPRCRLDDDWVGTQRKSLHQIVSIANDHKCNLIINGDIFDSTRQPAEIINMAIDELKQVKEEVFLIPGNHDLPYHNYMNEHQSAYGVLKRTFKEIDNPTQGKVIFLHVLTFPDEKARPIPDIGVTAEELLEQYPEADWIFTGDYHRAFHFERDHRHVINPGCINRQASDFIDYQPGVYFVDTESDIIDFIPIEDDEAMITDEYIKSEKDRESRIESFIEMVKNQGEITLDFMDNLKKKLESNELNKEAREVLMEIIEEIG